MLILLLIHFLHDIAFEKRLPKRPQRRIVIRRIKKSKAGLVFHGGILTERKKSSHMILNPLSVQQLGSIIAPWPGDSVFLFMEGSSAIAEFCGVEFNQTVVGTGSSEVIELICHALLNPRAEVVAAKHAFSMYPIMSKLFGAAYVEVPNKEDWTHDLNGFLDAITDNTRVVFITNPTNPVGTVVGQQEIDDFMAKVPEHVLVVFDEAYREFSDNPPDTLKFVREGRNVVVLRTFSKAYGLAGLRVGYGLAPEQVCSMLHKARAPFNLHVLAQEAALAALEDREHVRRTVENNKEGMRFYEQAFREMGLEWIPSQGNFILVKVGRGRQVFQDMLARGVIVRAQDGYGLPEWIRISVGTPAENARCIEVLKEVL